MNTYAEYKDSKVEWVGDIPGHWDTGKPKFHLNKVEREIQDEDEIVTCFRDGIVTLRKNRREDGFTVSLKEIGYQRVHKGDLVVHEMDGFEGSIGVSDSIGKSTPVYTVIEPSPQYDVRFWMYILREMSKTGFIESLSRSIRERTTEFRWKVWSNSYFPIVPLPEQHQIVTYLDQKTSQIDELIDKKTRKIDLLKEYRTALINQVVTKGLDPNVEMKDSGVEWIGEIPVGWTVSKIKRYCEVKDGTHETPEHVEPGGNTIPFVTSNYFLDGTIDFESTKHISFDKYVEINKRSDVTNGDIIMSMIGSNIGNLVLVDTDRSFSIKNLCLFKTSDSLRLLPKFFQFLLLSYLLNSQVDVIEKGGGQKFLSLDELRNLWFLFPNLQEQHRIVTYLDQKTQEIDASIETEEKENEHLKEYRQSLISNVVTGKIDVRDSVLS